MYNINLKYIGKNILRKFDNNKNIYINLSKYELLFSYILIYIDGDKDKFQN